MGKSKQQAPTEQTVTQSTLPEEFYPYLERTLSRAEGISNRPYETYTGPRIAGFSGDSLNSFDTTRNNVGAWSPYLDTARDATGQAMNGIGQVLQNRPSSTNLQNFLAPGAAPIQTGTWDQAAADRYMSPYITNVMDAQRGQMERAYTTGQIGIAARARNAGAFGGGRQGVAEAVLHSGMEDRLADQNAALLNQGYGNAQQMFSSDLGRVMGADQANQASDLTTQGRNLQSLLSTQQLGVQADTAGGDMALRGLGLADQLGHSMAGYGQQVAGLGAADADAMRSIGLAQEQQTQAGYDTAYSDFINQRDSEKNQLNYLSGIVHGLNLPSETSASTYSYQSPYAQAIGAGLGLTGLYQNLGGGQK